MKKGIISILFAAVLPVLVTAQEASKLSEALGEEALASMLAEQPEKVEFLKFKADHCYDVQDLSGKKDLSSYPDVSALNEFSTHSDGVEISAENFKAGDFNPLLYELGQNTTMTYYRVGDSGKLLKVYSDQRCRSLFNETK